MTITKKDITETLIKDNTIHTNIQIVANTYMNMPFDKLSKKLNLMKSIVNQELFRYFRKYPDKQIALFCNHEKVENNTHSHIILKVPPEYDVINVIKDLSVCWKKLDDRNPSKFELYYDLNVNDEYKSTEYAIKNFNDDNFIVI